MAGMVSYLRSENSAEIGTSLISDQVITHQGITTLAWSGRWSATTYSKVGILVGRFHLDTAETVETEQAEWK